MLNKELLDILVCPQNHLPLKMADPQVVDKLNAAIEAGTLHNAQDLPVEHKLDAGLIREDGRVLYPIVDGIPILLVEEAIPLESFEEEVGQ
ncbi:MAG: Trm112 family protein [Planctomycetales bacterium]|nr:Trm112 family protein [Planctomycetales bacterium]NIM09804.1 Trm112 family protein [Planctomycetales bacterium]NIN09273.1 Trm112 family protein [Planctomycetales bacterium]NIN78376.1 Trm112 family protein [Planctomycetales bacterium]NIO35552.1 Trm112 family protein [Planctomycetales bacterium]